MLLIGMASRVTTNGTRSFTPARWIPSVTWLPRGPRNRFTTLSCGILMPATTVSFTVTMRSPACIPALALGPELTTFSTITVSVAILKTTPIPSNSPSMLSFARDRS